MSEPARRFEVMSFEYIVAALLSVLLLAYLGYALIKPEKF
jgi:K+-transporting ATPase KdpF subunit